MRKNNESTVKERDVRFDLLKGIMIFLVVFGHLIGDYKANHVVHTEWHLIYLFHILYLETFDFAVNRVPVYVTSFLDGKCVCWEGGRNCKLPWFPISNRCN